jgi:hypothetical protein
LVFDETWLDEAPLTAAALTEEQQQWDALGIPLRIKELSATAAQKKRVS